jgi:hypothetical protein
MKIDGVMLTKNEKPQVGLFIFEREDGEKLTTVFDKQSRREKDLKSSQNGSLEPFVCQTYLRRYPPWINLWNSCRKAVDIERIRAERTGYGL